MSNGANSVIRVGFIGLGSMGLPMVENLLRANIPVSVWARKPSSAERVLSSGAVVADSPAHLCSLSDVILLCVSNTEAVEEVVFGSKGIAEAGEPGKIVMDHSTIHQHKTVEFAERLRKECGMDWIDAPVSGGVKGAEAGTLTVMAGGSEAALEKARPALNAIADRVTLLGPVGSGQVAKACNQLIIGASIQAISEALTMARNAGLDPQQLPDALANGWADSPILQNHGRKMAAMIAHPEPALEAMAIANGLMQKDMDIAADMSKQTGTPMPLTALVAQFYRMLAVSGLPQDGQIGLLHLLDSRN
jgi:3-hydroxyisobutyrate dehydrogenase